MIWVVHAGLALPAITENLSAGFNPYTSQDLSGRGAATAGHLLRVIYRQAHWCTKIERRRVGWLNGPHWEWIRESRKCSRDT
jgi:hypothetical protein